MRRARWRRWPGHIRRRRPASSMREPGLAAACRAARAEIDGVDALIRVVEGALEARQISKAELARRIGARPENIRRLLSDPKGNPTLDTIMKVLHEVGMHLEIAP